MIPTGTSSVPVARSGTVSGTTKSIVFCTQPLVFHKTQQAMESAAEAGRAPEGPIISSIIPVDP